MRNFRKVYFADTAELQATVEFLNERNIMFFTGYGLRLVIAVPKQHVNLVLGFLAGYCYQKFGVMTAKLVK